MTRRPLILVSGLFVLCLGIAGCGEPRATVSGAVTYNGKPMTGGTVIFVTDDNKRQERTEIKPDGTYSSPNVPVGSLRVAVMPVAQSLKAKMPKGVKMPSLPADSPAAKMYGDQGNAYVNISQDLRDPATSKITLTVTSGEVKDFPITLTGPK